MDSALTATIERAVMVIGGVVIIITSVIGVVRLYNPWSVTGAMDRERDLGPSLTLVCRLARTRLVLLIPGPRFLPKDVSEIEIEVKLGIFWLLLQPCVFLLWPGRSFEDEGVETEDAHHLLHVLGRIGRTQRGISGGGLCLYAVTNERGGGLNYERGIGGFRFYANIVPLVLRLILVLVPRVGRGEVPVVVVVENI